MAELDKPCLIRFDETMRLFLVFLFVFMPSAFADSEAGGDPRIEELRLVVRALRSENRRLRSRNDALANELVRLRQLLADEVGEPDTEAPEPEDAPPAEIPLPGHAILYVNPTWHYMILDAGGEAGLTEGDTGRVMREAVEIGRARITAVKPAQAVADLDLDSLRGQGQYPRAGDRVMFLPQP